MPPRKKERNHHLKQMIRDYAQQNVRPADENNELDIYKEHTMIDLSKNRADVMFLERAGSLSRGELETWLRNQEATEHDSPLEYRLTPYVWCTLKKEEAKKLYVQARYAEAIEVYKSAMRVYMGADAELPSPAYINDIYLAIETLDLRRMMDLVACASNIAQCYLKLGKPIETIDWTVEVEIIYIAIRDAAKGFEPSWINYNLSLVEYFALRTKARHRAYQLFKDLGNSGLAAHYCMQAFKDTTTAEEAANFERIAALRRADDMVEMVRCRHPDPRKLYDFEITQPTIQVAGVWRKLEVSPGAKPPTRNSATAWVWKSKLYVVGGASDVYIEYRDAWCLELATMRWHQLPDMPPINHQTGYNCHRQMQVWRGQAYLFDGSKRLWQLDCESETWRVIDTAFDGTWPYPKHRLSQFCTAIVDGTLYIFSGDDAVTCLGCNVFMSLPLPAPDAVPTSEKPVWTHLGGTSANVPCVRTPNLRTLATMWAVPAQRRLYVLGGNANRAAAHQKRLPGGNAEDFTYEDFWSFDCVGQTWTRERWRGSYPSPRTEMAGAWNGKLGAAGRGIVYGGYNASLQSAMPMDNGQDGVCGFTFFGDSFLFDPETKLWEHVIAKGFPSYRAQASMAVDEDTGFTYLYGGYVNTDYAPMKERTTRCFSDVWQLRLEMPGGAMTEEDRRIDVRTETMGPWRRCYTCGDVGFDYKKCSGTCGGRYFFCSVTCQRTGWSEHKQAQGCRKRT